jgi:8-amino-7-oxononanoate synthase
MEGDEAPVAAIADCCRRLGARLLVDEAHALGVLGREGAGVASAAGVRPDLIMGTFSKSLASCGGFVAGPQAVLDYLRIACRPLLFTASGAPAALGAALAALRIARAEEWRREALQAMTGRLRSGLADLGYRTPARSAAAIVPVHVDDEWSAGRLWRALLDRGVYTNCAVAPAVPSERALLRTSVMATHTDNHIDLALSAFEAARSTSD